MADLSISDKASFATRMTAGLLQKSTVESVIEEEAPSKPLIIPSEQETMEFFASIGLDIDQVVVLHCITIERIARNILHDCVNKVDKEDCMKQAQAMLPLLDFILPYLRGQTKTSEHVERIEEVRESISTMTKDTNAALWHTAFTSALQGVMRLVMTISEMKYSLETPKVVRGRRFKDVFLRTCAARVRNVKRWLYRPISGTWKADSERFEKIRQRYLKSTCADEMGTYVLPMHTKMQEIASSYNPATEVPFDKAELRSYVLLDINTADDFERTLGQEASTDLRNLRSFISDPAGFIKSLLPEKQKPQAGPGMGEVDGSVAGSDESVYFDTEDIDSEHDSDSSVSGGRNATRCNNVPRAMMSAVLATLAVLATASGL